MPCPCRTHAAPMPRPCRAHAAPMPRPCRAGLLARLRALLRTDRVAAARGPDAVVRVELERQRLRESRAAERCLAPLPHRLLPGPRLDAPPRAVARARARLPARALGPLDAPRIDEQGARVRRAARLAQLQHRRGRRQHGELALSEVPQAHAPQHRRVRPSRGDPRGASPRRTLAAPHPRRAAPSPHPRRAG